MKNIVENNKLIAEFMGVFDKILSTGNIHSWSDAPFYYTTEDTKEKVIKNICKYSKYDSDWNWLMEVVEKCLVGEAEYNEDEAKKAIREIYESLCNINISSVYNACVEFIKWYNNHLCSNCGRFDDVVGTHNIDTCEECVLNN